MVLSGGSEASGCFVVPRGGGGSKSPPMDKGGCVVAVSLVGEAPATSILDSPAAASDASSEAMVDLEGEVGALGMAKFRGGLIGSPKWVTSSFNSRCGMMLSSPLSGGS